MNYTKILNEYINDLPFDVPIFIEEIKEHFKRCCYPINNLYTYLCRFMDKGELKSFSKGVYYKGHITRYQVIEKKYIRNNDEIFGYLCGNSLLYQLGYIDKEPNEVYLCSNICYKGSRYYNKTLGVIVKKPKVKINCNNYKYLQLLDLLKCNINKKVTNKFIDDNNLNIEKMIEFLKL